MPYFQWRGVYSIENKKATHLNADRRLTLTRWICYRSPANVSRLTFGGFTKPEFTKYKLINSKEKRE
jgi:hypothetical protein